MNVNYDQLLFYNNFHILKVKYKNKHDSVTSFDSTFGVIQCSKLCQPLTFLSLTSSDPEKYKKICMNADNSRKIRKNTGYPQNHQKQHIIRKAKNI
jgi:hypothetical protein